MNKLYLIKDLIESILTPISLSGVPSVKKGGSSGTLSPGRAFDFVICDIFLHKVLETVRYVNYSQFD